MLISMKKFVILMLLLLTIATIRCSKPPVEPAPKPLPPFDPPITYPDTIKPVPEFPIPQVPDDSNRAFKMKGK